MTVAHPRITGGPANDLGLAAWAEVLRFAYATDAAAEHTDHPASDDHAIELFAAFLAGRAGPPAGIGRLLDRFTDEVP